ncbi:UPF0182 family protein [Luteipulveratus mongoliensis]|uniref:UPF0182 family membrane protein n=1 Tax=Luteipulveratus mongoliensis TaxID=571913 RepID=UPI001FE091EB|nr:UPF0182 family protein [Luteipulveratus mongoliensis]
MATALVAVVAVIVLALLWSSIWTEKLWYDSVGYSSVFRTELTAKTSMFIVGGVLTAVLIGVSLVLAYRHRPIYAPTTPEQDNLDRYRELLDPFRKAAFVAVPILFGLFAGVAAQAQWKLPLLWINRQSFGQKDPEFGLDIGFYVFTLPLLQFLVSFLTMALILSLVAAVLTHYVYGGISLQGKGPRTTGAARVHLSLLLAGIVLLRALSYWLDRYDLTTNDGRLFTGIGYTDQHAVLPTKAVLALAALLCAALFISTIWTRTWRLPLLGTGLLVVCAILIGGIYPALIQNFSVRPSEQTREAPFIKRNIDATRAAYGLTATKAQDYQPKTNAAAGQLRKDAATVPGIRIVDPAVVSPTYRQLQGRVPYYQFPDSLDVDRYKLGGQTVDTVIAVRELDLDGVPSAQRNWVNDHSVYTHGFGLVAAYGNKRTADGEPQFFERDIPPVGGLGKYEPRVYFGESSPTYSIVGGTKGGAPRELDYPDSATGGEKKTTYQGKGGVKVGSFARKLAYAVKYRQYNLMLSDVVNGDSKLLDHREPRERVKRVAPWLTLDGNAYPVVVDGRIKWVVDGYTTTSRYPYSQLASIGDVTSDSLTNRSQTVRSVEGGQVNYIRNSVKATVDAYDGSVDLYAWDDKDPILKAWSKAFGNTVKPLSKIDGDLMSHLRYPEDMFKVQRELLARYHVTEPSQFYQGNDAWQVPTDPTQVRAAGQQGPVTPPYYLSIAMPGQTAPAFSLTSTFIPTGDRTNLSGFMAVDADAGSDTGKKKPGYGTIRLLEMPRASTIKGPGQFQNELESSNVNSSDFTLTLSQFLQQNRSTATLGNLLTLPVGDGLLYVEPIYIQAGGANAYPLQRIVVTSFGNKLAWSATLDGALDTLFGGNSGASAGDAGTTPTPTPGTSPSPSPSGSPSPSTSAPPGSGPTGNLTPQQQAVQDIQKAYSDGQAALKKGDFAAYGEAQKRLNEAIQRAVKANPNGGSITVSPTPSTTPSPSTK